MAMPDGLRQIPGAMDLHDWFEYWPGFHDAEIISLHLNRSGSSSMRVHTWEMTKEVDSTGYYVQAKHVIVEFVFENISGLNLNGFSHQNVVAGLRVEKIDSGFRVSIDDRYGLGGGIESERLSVNLSPGKPTWESVHSVY